MNKYAQMFNPNGLKLPKRILKRDSFCAGAKQILPSSYLVEGMLTRVENQGNYPNCAAYAATTFAECVMWKRDGYPQQIDPVKIYNYAKTIDGDADCDGTLLECALEGLFEYGYFDRNVSKIKTVGGSVFGNDQDKALFYCKMACFRYGSCVIGCNIDESWYTPKNGIVKGGGSSLGGHAITLCGFDDGGIIIRNSWGSDWGHDGDAYIPNDVALKQFMYGATITNALNGITQ